MRTGYRVCLAALILSLALAAQRGSAQGDPSTDLKALRTKYDDCLVGIQTNAEQALEKWPQSYVDELKKAQKKLQDSGNLDGVLAIRNEVERFGKDKQIPDTAVSDFAPLKELHLRWRKMPEVIEIEKSKRITALSQSYMAALEEAKKKLTIQGKLELAIEAKNEVERVKTSAPVTAAEFALANAGARMAPVVEKGPKPAAEQPVDGSLRTPPGASPVVGVWKHRWLKKAIKDVSSFVELYPDGRFEVRGRPENWNWSGRYAFVGGSTARIKRTCNNGEIRLLEYDPAKDEIRQGDEVVFDRAKSKAK